MENWKGLIYNFEDLSDFYEISNLGNLRNSRTKKVLKLNKNHNGYLNYVATLGSREKIKAITIHRAVMCTFVPNPDNLPQINHIDGNKTNNKLENLEWCTASENMQHAIKNNLNVSLQKINSKRKKLSEDDVTKIKEMRKKGIPYRKIAGKFNVSHVCIIDVCKNRTYKK